MRGKPEFYILPLLIGLVLLYSVVLGETAKDNSGLSERDPVIRNEDYVVVECQLMQKNGYEKKFDIFVVPEWSPIGAQRFIDMVNDGFFNNAALFRAVKNFLVQFGISPDKEMNAKWGRSIIKDDPKIGIKIQKGTLAFAGGGKDSRSSQLFIALTSSAWPHLGAQPWETPFAYIPEYDIEILEKLNVEYGDMPPWGKGPDQGKIQTQGYSYLEENFPNLDYLRFCQVRKPVNAKERFGSGTPNKSESEMNGQRNVFVALPFTLSTFVIIGFIIIIIAVYTQLQKKNE